MREHYDSYRKSMQQTALEGYVEFAKQSPTANPSKWPTVYDYLKYAAEELAKSVDNPMMYQTWVKNHREGMLALFRAMVKATGLSPLDLIQKKGWKWFKYSDKPVYFDNQVWVPRYESAYSGRAHFDADEMALLFKRKPDKHWLKGVCEAKVQKATKIVEEDGKLKSYEVEALNNGTVRDWVVE